MSEAKFTKGEWYSVIRKTPTEISHVSVRGDFGGFEITKCDDAEANAHLISAAPDMYEILEFVSESPSETNVIAIRKILAKARGEK